MRLPAALKKEGGQGGGCFTRKVLNKNCICKISYKEEKEIHAFFASEGCYHLTIACRQKTRYITELACIQKGFRERSAEAR